SKLRPVRAVFFVVKIASNCFAKRPDICSTACKDAAELFPRRVATNTRRQKMLPTSTMPLLPLPGLVLFPRTMIQLHIFEPRYVRMVHDSLLRERRIATASLRPGWQKDYFGTPAVHRTVTAARILHEETLPGNRYNILLEGIERAQL